MRAVDGWIEAVYCCPEQALVVCHVAYELTLSVDGLHDSDQILIVSVRRLSVPPPHWTQFGLVISLMIYQSVTVRAVDGWTEAVYCCPEQALVVCHVVHELTLSVDVLNDAHQI